MKTEKVKKKKKIKFNSKPRYKEETFKDFFNHRETSVTPRNKLSVATIIQSKGLSKKYLHK